ncbi:MAG: hypothetical protein GY855_15130 [candidate division Zixibacteria bacterium]|nr:hypothetical protein [candidate division Zixibacteria bacterium]
MDEGINKYLKWGLIGGAWLFVLVYIALAIIRIGYPFELEWMEGGVVDHCRRILSGENIYVSPSVDFVPYIYTPLYYYLSAFFMKIFGAGFTVPRLISFIASLGCMLIIYSFVRRETGSKLSAFLSAALYAAAYRFNGAWYDLARVDSLYLLFCLSAIYVIRKTNSITVIIPAIALTLAYFTKQSALVLILCSGVYYVFTNRKQALVYWITIIICLLGLSVWFYRNTDGWFYYYTWLLPQSHDILRNSFVSFWPDFIFKGTSPILIVSAFYMMIVKKEKCRFKSFYFLVIVLGLIGSSYFQWIHSGAYDNAFIPASAGISLIFGVIFNKLVVYAQTYDSRWVRLLLVVAIIQFSCFVYLPHHQIPTSDDRKSGEDFICQVRALHGDVFIRDHGYYATLAGKRSTAHSMAIFDVIREPELTVHGVAPADLLKMNIIRHIAHHRFTAVIVDNKSGFPDTDLLEEYFNSNRRIFDSNWGFFTLVGSEYRPDKVYFNKPYSKAVID